MDALISAVVIMAAVFFGLRWLIRKRRFEKLLAKYGDAEIAKKIMRRTIWTGMTTPQLIDSIGAPVDTDERIYKSKISETYKYGRTGKNRFNLRITIENGIVVGWNKK